MVESPPTPPIDVKKVALTRLIGARTALSNAAHMQASAEEAYLRAKDEMAAAVRYYDAAVGFGDILNFPIPPTPL